MSSEQLVLQQGIEKNETQHSLLLDDLQEHMRDTLSGRNDYRERGEAAAKLAEAYRGELGEILQASTGDELSELVLASTYLSAVSSLGRLRQFIHSKKLKSPNAFEMKSNYLIARKQFQDDVDMYFEHFGGEDEASSHQALQEVVGAARLLISNRKWASALMHEHDHVFLGSVLSERVVAISLRESVHPGARYGTAEEDASPTKADVVLPFKQGDVHFQVKMKWMKPTKLMFHPYAEPPKVVVPMHEIRSDLTDSEDKKLAEFVKRAVARRA